MKLEPIDHPFTPPLSLQNHLKKYPLEYGSNGREDWQWKADTLGWRILENAQAQEIGFVWLTSTAENPRHKDLLLAVYDPYKNHGYGNSALNFIESQVQDLSVEKIRCQVNSNRVETGLIVRKWLNRRGFKVYNRDPNPRWISLSDDEYLCKCYNPVYFFKDYSKNN
ncbi:MAG TPA: hypothetical protein VGH19_22975 [Verrucomicrobiae bacterium]